mmetsp:Transcript_15873/g.43134  ORF Transcript_15873/g.43134 Transcript_15873/m.43134 type:complete len:201 (-) Transcript_15873:456-1058(-)
MRASTLSSSSLSCASTSTMQATLLPTSSSTLKPNRDVSALLVAMMLPCVSSVRTSCRSSMPLSQLDISTCTKCCSLSSTSRVMIFGRIGRGALLAPNITTVAPLLQLCLGTLVPASFIHFPCSSEKGGGMREFMSSLLTFVSSEMPRICRISEFMYSRRPRASATISIPWLCASLKSKQSIRCDSEPPMPTRTSTSTGSI